uniref:CD59 glycoprotein-like n=1 Tax=Neogobius melanostomus TaxID=47308 RepID=A0A8C6UGX9_9GOBI
MILPLSLQRLNMKLLALALAVALLFTAGECLDCHKCLPRRAGENCELAVETCKYGKNGCAAAKFTRAPFGQYQKCMALADCNLLKLNAYINIKCCGDNLCNTFDD